MKNPLRRAKSSDSYRSQASSKVPVNHEALARTQSETTQKPGLFDKLRTRIRRPSLREQERHSPDANILNFTSNCGSANTHSLLRTRRSIPVPLTIRPVGNGFTEPMQNAVRYVRQPPAQQLPITPEKSVSPTTPPTVPERSLVSLGLVPLSAPKGNKPSPRMSIPQSQYEIPSSDSPLSPTLSPFLSRQTSAAQRKSSKPLPPLPAADLHPNIPEEDDVEMPPQEVAPAPPSDLEYWPVHESISVTSELRRLFKYGWYWGPISRSEAERLLENRPDGTFLVRNSHDQHHLLSLSFRSLEQTLHARIDYENGKFSFHPCLDHESFASVVELVEHAMKTASVCYSRFSREPASPTFPVRLIAPISRFDRVTSLKYMCRFVIRLHIRADHLASTPLPDSIRKFLSTLNS